MRADLCVLFMLVGLIGHHECAKILGVFPMPAPSHYFLGSTLMKGLAEAGHDVTMISPFTEKEPPKAGTYTEIYLDDIMAAMQKLFVDLDPLKKEKKKERKGIGGIATSFILGQMSELVNNKTLKHPKVQALIRSNATFDAVIVTQFVNDAMKAFAHHFNAHLILFSNTASNSWLNHLVGNPSMPSFAPEMLLGMPDKMSFLQRVLNSIFKLITVLYFQLSFYPMQNQFIQENFPNPVHIDDILYNASLVLLNSHESVFMPQPKVPCMIEIGGFHVKPPKGLPRDLKKFLDEAKEGVIYFSMGSNLRSQDLPIEKREALLNAFGKRKEKVLWKWEDDVLPGQPPNVKLEKWLAQQDVLAHPNVKLFITHGGLLSTIETVYHGVPVIAIPILGDQKLNANNAQKLGYGIIVEYDDLSEQKLSASIEEILSNPSYTKNVKERSKLMLDRQVKPLDTAIYWVEYVIRHNGARHLRVPYMHLTWYEFYLLDVIAFLTGVILIVTFGIWKTCSYLCSKRRDRTKSKKE